MGHAAPEGSIMADSPPTLGRFDHITLPSRNAQESKRFWVGVLGAKVAIENPTFVEVQIGDIRIGFREKSPLPEGDTEAPHFAFLVAADEIRPLKARLEQHGVRTQPLWTRSGGQAHMYFKDPSGNLFELISPGFEGSQDLPRTPTDGGSFDVGLRALDYDWRG